MRVRQPGKPDVGKSLLAAAYGDDKADIAVGPTSSGVALAMLPVAEEYKKILLVEPAVADSITGDKWNKYIFRTGRNSSQDAISNAVALGKAGTSIATLAQDYAFGRDGVKAFKDALKQAKIVHEEYLPQNTTDFTAGIQRVVDAGKRHGVATGIHSHDVGQFLDDAGIAVRGRLVKQRRLHRTQELRNRFRERPQRHGMLVATPARSDGRHALGDVAGAEFDADRLGFIDSFEATSATTLPGVEAPTRSDSAPADGVFDTFLDVRGGTELVFTLGLRNVLLMEQDFEQVFRITIRVVGDGVVLIEETLRVIIPAADPTPAGDAGP